MPSGRRRQPIAILKQTGKKHLTKAEIVEREESEIKIGSKRLITPEFVKNNPSAYKKWRELMKVYRKNKILLNLTSSSDIGILTLYCLTHSQYLSLLKLKNNLYFAINKWKEKRDLLSADLIQQIEETFQSEYLIRIETAINSKSSLLLKMENRLFLNPKAYKDFVVKEKPAPIDRLFEMGFDV